jgi:hypothetical protein
MAEDCRHPGPNAGFLVVFDFGNDDRPLIIEDDGSVCHAYVRGPTGDVVTAVWLYNRTSGDLEEALDWGEKPFPSSEAEFRASICKSTNRPTVFSVFIRGELFAILRVGERIGMSKLVSVVRCFATV